LNESQGSRTTASSTGCAKLKPIADENYLIPETAQIDELQTFVGSKKTRSGDGVSSIAISLELLSLWSQIVL
jgi:hypothetical protein